MLVWIRRIVARLAVGTVVAAAGLVATASPAQAFGGEVLGCRFSPGPAVGWTNPCYNLRGATRYNAGFWLQNTGPGYTYSWSWTGPVSSVFVGCTSTSYDCGLYVPNTDGIVQVTVTYTDGVQTASRTATAVIRQFCGTVLC